MTRKKTDSTLTRLSVWTAAARLLQALIDLLRDFEHLLHP
jgi:hypothetical protein